MWRLQYRVLGRCRCLARKLGGRSCKQVKHRGMSEIRFAAEPIISARDATRKTPKVFQCTPSQQLYNDWHLFGSPSLSDPLHCSSIMRRSPINHLSSKASLGTRRHTYQRSNVTQTTYIACSARCRDYGSFNLPVTLVSRKVKYNPLELL